MPAPAAAFPVTRARADRKRKVGLANVVARCRLLPRVGTMSDGELLAIRRLANADKNVYERYRRDEDARRREASKARTALWPDTVHAKQEAFLLQRQKKKEEAEERENLLLELDAKQQEEERRQRQAQLALMQLKEDPRGRNVRSLMLLHEAMKDREMQLAFNKELRAKEEEEERVRREVMDREFNEYSLKLGKEKLDRCSRNVAEKNSHLQQMLFQIQERKQQRAEQKESLEEVKHAAEEEAEDNAEELREQRRKMAAVHAHNRSVAKPPLTKRDRLLQRIERDKDVDELLALHEEKLNAMKRVPLERWQKKQAWFERCKEESRKLFEEENEKMRHKERTQDVFELRGTNMIDAMAAMEDRRKEEALEKRHRSREEFLRVAEGFVEELPEGVRRAEAHRAGFTNDEEAREYQIAMRAHPATVRAEQQAEAARRREEAERVRRIQRLQAAEKRENERREAEEMVEAQRRQLEAMEEDNERYRVYVKSQVPTDMDPYLYDKAMKLHI